MHQKINKIAKVCRPWGSFTNLESGDEWHLKTIRVDAGQGLSLQSHRRRKEIWIVADGVVEAFIGSKKQKLFVGDVAIVHKNQKHRLSSKNGATLIEISLGNFDENDIMRYEDDYGRIEKR